MVETALGFDDPYLVVEIERPALLPNALGVLRRVVLLT